MPEEEKDKYIPSLLTTLFERLSEQEDLELEFKAAQGSLPQSLWPTLSAFANTRGGWVLLGVEENEDGINVTGVQNPSALLDAFYSSVRNPQKVSALVCGADDGVIEKLSDGTRILVLRVPAAPRKLRPVYVGGNPYNGTFLRRNSGDYRCTKPEVDRMMREASDVATDSTTLSDFTWNDLEHEALARYRQRYRISQPASPFNSYNDKEFLVNIGGYSRKRGVQPEGITVAGLLMFGSPNALREWRTRHLIDYRLVSGDTNDEARWDDRVAWEGNLFGAYETIYPRLVANQSIPFRLERGVRVDDPPSHVALREALVNFLVHADYSEFQSSLIIQSPQEYFFRNPGNSRVSEADMRTGDRSDPRNPELVRMFRFIGVADEAGTGIPKIISAWRTLGFHMPDINTGTERYEFSLKLRHSHLLSGEDRKWLSSIGGSWTEAEQLALVTAKRDGSIDNLKLRRLTNQHPADITKVLGGLRDRELLTMIGDRRGARYELGAAAPIDKNLRSFSVSSEQEGLPFQTGIKKTEVRGSDSSALNFQGGELNSQGRELNSQGKGAGSQYSESITPEIRLQVEEISRKIAGRRLTPKEREETILRLCALTPLSLKELAAFMNRNEEYIRQMARPLLGSGRLTYLYPDRVNHPRQKYVTSSAYKKRLEKKAPSKSRK